METHYVYELINLMGSVEYVGETTRPNIRMKDHIKKKPTTGHGKFYGRTDLIMNIVAQFDNRIKARELEDILKIEYGFKLTERSRGKKAGKLKRYLTIEQAKEIREIYSKGGISQYKLAKQYGIPQCSIFRIIKKQAYNNE